MFINDEEAKGTEYGEFWATLNRGQCKAGEFKRFGKGGREVWILASYNPILAEKGKPFKVMKFAIDTTEAKLKNADLAGQIAAINKSQAVIEFNMDGKILGANENFLQALGYSLAEIVGSHHSMFVDETERASSSYQQFWANLNRGEYQAGEFKRVGRGGKEVWRLHLGISGDIQGGIRIPLRTMDGKCAAAIPSRMSVIGQEGSAVTVVGDK